MGLGFIRVGGFGWANGFELTLPPLVLMEGSFLVVEAVSGSLIVRMEDKVGGGFSLFISLLDVSDLNGKISEWINLAGLQSSMSKLAKIKVQGVYWPLVQSSRGVLAFLPTKYLYPLIGILQYTIIHCDLFVAENIICCVVGKFNRC